MKKKSYYPQEKAVLSEAKNQHKQNVHTAENILKNLEKP